MSLPQPGPSTGEQEAGASAQRERARHVPVSASLTAIHGQSRSNRHCSRLCSRRPYGCGHRLCKQVLACRRYQQQDASLNAARYGIGSVAIACATGRQLGEVVEGDVPDDFNDELGREFGGGVA